MNNRKDYMKKYNKEYNIKNKDSVFKIKKAWELKSRYNLTMDQYDLMLKQQDNCCKICNIHESNLYRKLSVDHCHITGKVRGLLCMKCNTLLSNAKDNTNILTNAIDYLNNNNK